MARARFFWLIAVGLLAAALLPAAVGVGGRGVLAGLPPGPTPTPKPNGLGPLSGVYDALLHDGTKTSSGYHCMFRIDHDSVSHQAKAAAQCYADTPGLTPGSPLIDPADGAPGAPPPPPYNTAPPMKFYGAYAQGSDTLTLAGCIKNVGGAFAPNVIMQLTVPAAVASLPDLEGTALVYQRQSSANCAARTPSGAPSSQALNLTRVSSGRDFDGDGCSDAQELDKPSPQEPCGDDPFNPHDADLDVNGPFSATAPFLFADWDGALVPGIYFSCLGNADHDLGTNAIDARARCYANAPAYAALGGSAVPWHDVGLPSAPPPPPFTPDAPIALTGGFASGAVLLLGCLPNIGGWLGPNAIVEFSFDLATGAGYAAVFGNQTNAGCDADPPLPEGLPEAFFALDVAPQDLAWDADGDGCTNAEELAVGGPPPACGDDPFNPFDSDINAGGVAHLVLTVNRAGWNGAVVPGAFYHCSASTEHDGSTNALTTRVFCYVDDAGLTVNCQAVAGAPTTPCAASASTCPPADAVFCGDGLRDPPPPRIDPDPDPPERSAYGDVDSPHATLAGSYQPSSGLVTLAGCVQDVENSLLGPSVYLDITFDITTGLGTGLLYPHEQTADCVVGAPLGSGQSVVVAWAEQGAGFDTDRDTCSDSRELSDAASTGGLRDPFNHWDFRTVPTGLPPTRDRSVVTNDVTATVARFGATDAGGSALVNRYSHPVTTPISNDGAYYPAFDTAGGLIGSVGPRNLKGPDGAIAVADVAAIVSQFGNTCG